MISLRLYIIFRRYSMSENTPEDTEEAAATTATPPEPPKPDSEPEHKAEPKKPVDKVLAAAAKAAKLKPEDVLAFKDYDDKVVVVTRSGQKVTVAK